MSQATSETRRPGSRIPWGRPLLAVAVVLLSLAIGALSIWRAASGLKQPETVSVAEEPPPGLPGRVVQKMQCPDCTDLIVQIRSA